ncbi:class I SAM-dependent methyltransferase [Roseomonas rosulenta]|uniref:class I SAM-dependent methyltransferase n=1 Tax=Roseomonas rosulenta TaxID=2748667 RepID=UPI0018DF9CE7|nr:class I SAM-dependent methyltransferase [Roseomonas rosulenta]
MKLHAVANSALRGVLPFQGALRRLKRRLRPYRDDPANSDYCLTQGLEQIEALRAAGVAIEGSDVLEFGSGWVPIIPLVFALAGARRVILTDVARLMDEHTTERAKEVIAGRIHDVATVLRQTADELWLRLRTPFTPSYLVPWDAETHPTKSVDIVISRAVLEHVPAETIRHFLGQFHRILRPNGAMCHVIDNSDHWQHRDRSLSRVDFLRYEDNGWRWRVAQVNEQSFQNRLRHSDYRRMLAEAGFTIAGEVGTPDARCLVDLQDLKLARRFQGRDMDDLAILESLFVARKL